MTGVVEQKKGLVFEITMADAPSKRQRGEGKKVDGKVKKDYEGITFSRFGFFPTCPWCRLMDLGKEAAVRPDEKHMVSCKDRPLDIKPFTEVLGVRSERRGDFIGEAPSISVRYPTRLIRKIKVPILDAKGKPTGQTEEKFICSYKWKTNPNLHSWVWNGHEWVSWFAYNPPPDQSAPKAELPALTEAEVKWLAAFMKK